MSSSSHASAWTAERIKTLARLWRDGQSAAQIAKALGGVTRNAVIGKVHRLGLSARSAPSAPGRRAAAGPTGARTRSARSARSARPAVGTPIKVVSRPARPAAAAAVFDVPTTPLLIDACALTARTCRWPIGDPGAAGFGYCGRKVTRRGPYCAGHRGLAYVRPSRWQAEALRPPPG